MRSVSSSLTSVELRLPNNLNNIYPCPCSHPAGEPPRVQPPKLVHGWPASNETDSDSWKEPSDSEEWDEHEHGNWSYCPTPPVKEEGLTWEEITSEPPQMCIFMESDPNSDWNTNTSTTHQRSLTPKVQANRVHPEKIHCWKP